MNGIKGYVDHEFGIEKVVWTELGLRFGIGIGKVAWIRTWIWTWNDGCIWRRCIL